MFILGCACVTDMKSRNFIYINASHSIGCGTHGGNEGSENPLSRAAILLALQKVAIKAPNMYQ